MSGVIAVLGFGEAGSLIARDLAAAGAAVRGFDPRATAPAGVTAAASDADAVTGADLVLSVNSASEAVAAFTASVDALAPTAIWADLNTASPAVKQRLAALGRERAIAVTDIAMMAPVPGNGPARPDARQRRRRRPGRGHAARLRRRHRGARRPGRAGRDPQAAAQRLLQGHGRVRSSRHWRRRGRPASRTGCARTSPRTWPRPTPRRSSGSSPAPGGTPSAAVTRWRPPPKCSPTWASSPSWPTPAAPCTSAWPQTRENRPVRRDNSKKRPCHRAQRPPRHYPHPARSTLMSRYCRLSTGGHRRRGNKTWKQNA